MKDKLRKFWKDEHLRIIYYVSGFAVGALAGAAVVYERTHVINVEAHRSSFDEMLQEIVLIHKNGLRTDFCNVLIPED